jgi:urea carboxylase
VCPVVIAKAELWKIGQVKPGDLIRFVPISFQTAVELEIELLDTINSLSNMRNPSTLKPLDNIGVCILKSLPANDGMLSGSH